MDAPSLPLTCGEVMDIPGTTCVGCAAIVPYGTSSLSGFSCCVIASHTEVHLLGPDIVKRDGTIISVKLWSPNVEQGHVRITSIVAFLPGAGEDGAPGTPDSTQQHEHTVPDTTYVVVAWESSHEHQQQPHVTTLFFSLLDTLSAPDNPIVVANETTFFKERNRQRLVRLFYNPLFSVSAKDGEYVVLCSCYHDEQRKEASTGPNKRRNQRVLTPGDPHNVINGCFSFVHFRPGQTEERSLEAMWLIDAPSCTAPWLVSPSCGGIVSALTVQKQQGEAPCAVAAMGTTRGRVIIMYNGRSSVVRRSRGPIADVAFVESSDAQAQVVPCGSDAVEQLQRRLKVLSDNSPVYTSRNESGKFVPTSLVVLDSLGYIMVIRHVNGDASTVQMVPDVQQFITLSWGILNTASKPDASGNDITFGSGECSASQFSDCSKSSSDLPPGRIVFCRHRQRYALAGEDVDGTCTPPTNDRGDTGGDSTVKAMYGPGHVLSSGLLSIAVVPESPGRVEFVVSTMGQLIASVVWNEQDDTFGIGKCLRAPESMFFVGFVDFFNTGVAEVVMAGVHHVLVSRRSRREHVARALLLLHLLDGNEGRTTTTDSTLSMC